MVVADTSPARRAHVQSCLGVPALDPSAADFTDQLRAQFGGALAQKVIDHLAERPAQIEQEKQSLMSGINDAEHKRQLAADELQVAENTAGEVSRALRDADSALADAREARAMAQAGAGIF